MVGVRTDHTVSGESCEWWPDANQPATSREGCPNDATLSVGADPDVWHLCATCADLPAFSRKRRRVPLNHETRSP